jgi:signal transduction histidine kinase
MPTRDPRYHNLFRLAPIPLWEADGSRLKAHLASLRHGGVADLAAHLRADAGEVRRCAQMVRLLDCNDAAVALHRARSREELLGGLDGLFVEDTYAQFVPGLLALAEGRPMFDLPLVLGTCNGKRVDVSARFLVPSDHQESLERVYLVMIDETERNRTQQQVQRYQERLRALASRMSLAEERERHEIASELHDGVGQNLAFIQMRLAGVRASHSWYGEQADLDQIVDLVEDTIRQIRSLTFELSPPALYELGFEAAAEWLASHLRREHGLPVVVEDDGQHKPLNQDVRPILFRALREILINVVKHAQATRATVRMEREGGMVRLTVTDDGVGFNEDASQRSAGAATGYGLFSVRERIEHLGGKVEIRSTPGAGTTVTLAVPICQPGERNGEVCL